MNLIIQRQFIRTDKERHYIPISDNGVILDPSFGYGVSHDILEHPDISNWSTEEEFEALGRMFYIRGKDLRPHDIIYFFEKEIKQTFKFAKHNRIDPINNVYAGKFFHSIFDNKGFCPYVLSYMAKGYNDCKDIFDSKKSALSLFDHLADCIDDYKPTSQYIEIEVDTLKCGVVINSWQSGMG